MAVGQGELQAGLSYVAIGRETAFGTYTTCTAGLAVISAALGTVQERKTLDQVETRRTMSQGFSTKKTVEGDLEFYVRPTDDAFGYLLQNAFGGTVTSATATGETIGAGAASAILHTFDVGSMDQSYTSICINVRKGPTTTGKIFQYHGLRVGEITFTAGIEEPLTCKLKLMGQDSTSVANDVAGALASTIGAALSYVSGRMSVEGTLASLTSGSFWHIQSAEWGWSNSLKSDSASRRIGSNVLSVLPPGVLVPTLKATIRYDTTTAFDAMIAASQLAIQLEFQGPTLTGSNIRQGLRFDFPKVFILDAGDPEIGGPDEMLSSDVTFQILRDDSSATGYAIKGYLTNQKANYA